MSAVIIRYSMLLWLITFLACPAAIAQVCDSSLHTSNCYWCNGHPNCDPPIHCSLGSLDDNCLHIFHLGGGFDALGCPTTYRTSRHIAFVAGENQAHLRLHITNCDPTHPEGILAGVFHYSTGFCDTTGMVLLDSDCNCTLEGDSIDLEFPTVPGDTYVLEIGGCNHSECDIFFEVLEGGDPLQPASEEPISLTPQATHFSTPDSICQGSREVPFTVSPSLENSINNHYVFYIDGDPVEAFYSDTLLSDWDVPEGTYELCVAGATECDTSDLLCTTVEVVRDNIAIDTLVCEDELPFTFLGEDYSETSTFTVSDSFPDGCQIDYQVDLTVASPVDTMLEAWICPGESYEVGGVEYTDEGSYPPVTLTHPITGCDSTVHLSLYHITALFVFGQQSCENGVYSLPVQIPTTPDNNQVDITYSWYDNIDNVVGTEQTLEVSDPGDYYLVVEVNYEGKICTFTSNFVEITDDIPPPLTFEVFPDTVCEGETAAVRVNPPGNAAGYNWTLPSGTSQQSGGSSNEITIQFSEVGQKEICATAYNDCGSGDEVCDTVTVLSGSGNTYAGPDSSVCGLSVGMVAEGMGQWRQESGAGTSMFSDPTDSSARVTVDTPGIYIYSWQTGSGGCDGRDDVQITFFGTPQYDSVLYSCSADQNWYTAEFQMNGAHPPFTLLSGPGRLDSSGYFISDSIPAGTDTTIVLTDTAGCTVAIPLSKNCDCGIQAGILDTTDLTLCAGDTAVIVYSDSTEIRDTLSVRQFVLTDSSANILQSTDTSFFVFDADTLEYGVTYFGQVVLAYPDSSGQVDLSVPCTQFSGQVSITWHAYPTAGAGSDTTVCGDEFTLSTSVSSAVGSWLWHSGPDTPLIDRPQDTTTRVEVDRFGEYAFLRIEDNLGCSDTDMVLITFVPPLRTFSIDYACDSSETTYMATVQFDGTAPFFVQSGAGMVDSSGLYTSPPLPSGVDTTIAITDSNGCLLALELNKDCDCQTEIGTVTETTLELCRGDTAFIPYDPSSEVLDSNDTRAFVLRDSSGNILFRIASGIFPFEPPLQTGTTYEVIVYVGDSLADGSVDRSANCTRQSEIVNLIWFDRPTAHAGTDTLFCSLAGSLNATPSPATGQWRQLSGPGMANISQSMFADTDIDVNSVGDYLFEWEVQNGPCSDLDTVQLTFTLPLDIEDLTYTCDQSNYIATAQITGGTLPYTLLSGGGSISAGQYTSESLTSGTLRDVQIQDVNGCRMSFELLKDCECAVAAQIEATSSEFTCRDSIITLHAENSMPRDSLNYQWWTTNGNITSSDLSAPTIDINQSGTYHVLVVHSQNGCRDTTEVEITAAEMLTETEVEITHESCVGKEDGQIHLSPLDGESPYNYLLSTSAENTSGLFTDLAPGAYSVTITDANGCQLTRDFNIEKGTSVTVDIGPDREVTPGDSVLIRLLQPEDSIDQILWQVVADYSCRTADCSEIVVYPTSSQQIKATVTTRSDCRGADSLLIFIVEEDIAIYVPNAFTPNGDNINDYFFISAGEQVSHIKLLAVYDRWGNLMFEGRQLLPGMEQSGWDGTYRGQKAPPGVYVYIAELILQNGETVIVKGDVALIK